MIWKIIISLFTEKVKEKTKKHRKFCREDILWKN